MDEIGLQEARATLGEIVDRARLADSHTRITRQGKAAAMVVGIDWYDDVADLIAMAVSAVERGGFTIGDMEFLGERYRDQAVGLRRRQAAERRGESGPGV